MLQTSLKPLEELFRAKIINYLVTEKLLSPEKVQVLYSWKHSGFGVDIGKAIPYEAKTELEGLSQYILRNPFSDKKIKQNSVQDTVIYLSQLNEKVNSNFRAFSLPDLLVAVTQHIPEKGDQTIRYFGYYSNKARGRRKTEMSTELDMACPGVTPTVRSDLRWKRPTDKGPRRWALRGSLSNLPRPKNFARFLVAFRRVALATNRSSGRKNAEAPSRGAHAHG